MDRIIMLCGTFYPNNNPRAVQCTELYKELTRRGYSIDLCIPERKVLLSPDEVGVMLRKPPSKEKNYIKEYRKLKGFISKWICYFIGQKAFYIYYGWIRKNIDLSKYNTLIAISAPFYNIVLGARLLNRNKFHNIVSICDNGDPFYDPARHSVFVRKIQEWAYERYQYICFPVENAKSYYCKYANESKFRIIPQGRDFNAIRIKDYKEHEVPTFAYAGCFFIDIRNPDNFLTMLESVDKPFKLILFTETIGTVYQKILMKHKEILKEKLEIRPFLPRIECIYELSGMDFLVNFQNMSQVQVPSKLIDYTLSGRPILSTRQDKVDRSEFESFLKGDYTSATKIDISMYDIRNVVNQYCEMINRK